MLDFRFRRFPHKLSGDRDLMQIILLWEKTHFATIYLHKIYMQYIVRVWYPTLLEVSSCERSPFLWPNAFHGFRRHLRKEKLMIFYQQ